MLRKLWPLVFALAFASTFSLTALINLPAYAGRGQASGLRATDGQQMPAAGYVVNSLDDANDGICDLNHCSLREAITAANLNAGADTITFSVSGTITLTSSLPPISDTLAIDGSGQNITISGASAYQVLHANNSVPLTLVALTISNGNCNCNGGGVYGGGMLTISNAIVYSNTATSGGGVYANLDLMLTSTEVMNNTAEDYGGGVANGGRLTMTNSTLSGNSAPSGGGLFNRGFGTATVANSAFFSNRSPSGGGISNSGTLTVTNSTFSGNDARFSNLGGGGLFNYGTLTVMSTTLSGNIAAEGGGIDNYGTLMLITSTFLGNGLSCYTDSGGGIGNHGLLVMRNSTFDGNSACYDGGGILNEGIVMMTNSTLTNNYSYLGYGGGIANSYGTVTVTNSTLSHNITNESSGGGIYNHDALAVTNSNLINNVAGEYGGGIYNLQTLSVLNSTFFNNGALYGGGLYNSGEATVRNTIVGLGPVGWYDACGGVPLINGGNNLDDGTSCGWGSNHGSMSNTDPHLGPLADNGGSAQTMALLWGSPAIDGVTFNAPNGCPATDQRGVTRPIGARGDIGAYEADFRRSFLPLVTRNSVAAPDLIINNLIASTHTVTVVIQNIGPAPVVNDFWVDLYVNPQPAPIGVNQVWNDGRSTQGVVWGITAPALPFQPGEVLTLTLSSPYYWRELSHLVYIAPNTSIYAQVDSADMATTYGAVLETHEINGGPYNNILGSVLSGSGMTGQTLAPLIDRPSLRIAQLPRRPGH